MYLYKPKERIPFTTAIHLKSRSLSSLILHKRIKDRDNFDLRNNILELISLRSDWSRVVSVNLNQSKKIL